VKESIKVASKVGLFAFLPILIVAVVSVAVLQPAKAYAQPASLLVDAVVADLATRATVSADDIVVARSEPVTWSDGCLGVEQVDEACTQALVDGWVIWLAGSDAEVYRYHASEDGVFRFAAGPISTQVEPTASAPLPAGATARALGFTADLPTHGVALAIWQGGPAAQLASAAPGAVSFWVTSDGRFVGYVPDAPNFVNASFLALFGGTGEVPDGTIVLIAFPRLESATTN